MLSKKLLINEGSEVSCEQLFSAGSLIDSDLRKNLKDETLSDLLFLSGNREFLFKHLDKVK